MTIHQATDPNALSMMSFIRIQGPQVVEHRIAQWIREADMISGGKTPPEVLSMLSGMLMEKMKHRSVASVLMALRDGVSYTDEDGKVYGSITWPKICIWLDRHEEKVLAIAHDTHASQVTKGDNYDSRWLDEQEAKSPKVQDRKDRIIETLKNKLEKR